MKTEMWLFIVLISVMISFGIGFCLVGIATAQGCVMVNATYHNLSENWTVYNGNDSLTHCYFCDGTTLDMTGPNKITNVNMKCQEWYIFFVLRNFT